MPLIPERLIALMTDEERAEFDSAMNGWRYSPVVTCPQCNASIGVKLKVTAGAVFIDHQGQINKPPARIAAKKLGWDVDLNDEEQDILREAEDSGLLVAFTTAVLEEKGAEVPADLKKFLLTFLRTAREKQMPRFLLDRMRDEFDGYLRFFSGQGLIAVTADGVLRHFIPMRFIGVGNGKKPGVPGGLVASFPQEAAVERWVRGKFGYVPAGAKAFGAALGQRSVGSFGRLVQ